MRIVWFDKAGSAGGTRKRRCGPVDAGAGGAVDPGAGGGGDCVVWAAAGAPAAAAPPARPAGATRKASWAVPHVATQCSPGRVCGGVAARTVASARDAPATMATPRRVWSMRLLLGVGLS